MKTIKLFLATLLAGGLSLESKAQVFTSDDMVVEFLTNGNHDSTQCMTLGSLSYHVQVENSYLNDTCRLVDLSTGQLMYQEVNTTGQTPWIFIVPVFTNVVMDQYLTGNTALFAWGQTKLTTLHDTITDLTNVFQIPVLDPCAYGTVSGRVYVDMNSDCSYNTGDLDLSNVMLQINTDISNPAPSSLMGGTSTNFDGTYNYTVQESWMDQYTVGIPASLGFIFPSSSCSPGTQTFTTLPQANVDFPLQCTGNVDVMATIGSNGFVRPNIPFFLHPSVSNTGCDAVSGVLKLVLDQDVVYDPAQSSNPAASVSGDTLYWNYSNLTNISSGGYWNSFFAGVHLTPTLAVNIGDTLCFKVITSVPSGDLDPVNNVAGICLPVVNSYDPNMKEVAPKGQGVQGFIPQQTEKLRYTIHFQNTGNAVAYNISILDTLSANLDPSSVKILSASHIMTPEWLSSSVLKFNFYTIMLPDSTSNEPASHGFVTFEVNVKDNIQLGETIKNTGHIYFDFNPAIVTNTALNTIKNIASTETLSENTVSIQPNPASSKIRIVADDIRTVQILDFSGKTVLKDPVMQNGQIDVSELTTGMYLVQVETAKGLISKKLLIQQ